MLIVPIRKLFNQAVVLMSSTDTKRFWAWKNQTELEQIWVVLNFLKFWTWNCLLSMRKFINKSAAVISSTSIKSFGQLFCFKTVKPLWLNFSTAAAYAELLYFYIKNTQYCLGVSPIKLPSMPYTNAVQ